MDHENNLLKSGYASLILNTFISRFLPLTLKTCLTVNFINN
jgi:hypothetical protein